MALPAAVGLDVAEVAGVAIGIFRAAVLAAVRIEVAAGALAVGHRAIAEFVDVEAVLAGLQAGELANDFDAVALLRERDFAFHFVFAEAFDDGDRHRDLDHRQREPQLRRCGLRLRLGRLRVRGVD